MAAREGAVNAKRAGLCQLRDLLITTPEPLRAELRPLTRAGCSHRLAATRPATPQRPGVAWRAARAPLGRSPHPAADRRGTRARPRDQDPRPRSSHHSSSTSPASGRSSPPRSCSPGPTRAGSEAKPRSRGSPASPRSPPPPDKRSATASTAAATDNSTGHSTRSSSPDAESHPATIAYIERRISEGKTRREANRCLKRYLARNLFRLLENGAPTGRLTNIEASLAHATGYALTAKAPPAPGRLQGARPR